MKAEIHSLFPTPVYFTKINRKFSKQENDYFNKPTKVKNIGNLTSKDKYVLDKKPFIKLKKELLDIVKNYYQQIICTSNDIEPTITQSWLNYTNKKEYHHIHSHPNSYISGVLYINADKENDKINFFRQRYEPIKPVIKSYNVFNAESWWFPVETYQVVLFPSYLTHSVEIKEGSNTRISLAFNTFYKGTIGLNSNLTELIL